MGRIIASVLLSGAALAAAWGCEGGDLEPSADAEAATDGGQGVGGDRFISTDLDVRTADGSHACGFFPDTCPAGANCYNVRTDGALERTCLRYDPGSAGDDCTTGRLAQCGDGRRCYRGTCRPICRPDGSSEFGCESGDVCVRIQTDRRRLSWGVCIQRTDECTLWPNDDCPEGENCYSLPRGHRCLEYDADAETGDACEGSTDCRLDQVCVNERDGAGGQNRCRDKCDEEHPCDNGRCGAISQLEFGACFSSADAG